MVSNFFLIIKVLKKKIKSMGALLSSSKKLPHRSAVAVFNHDNWLEFAEYKKKIIITPYMTAPMAFVVCNDCKDDSLIFSLESGMPYILKGRNLETVVDSPKGLLGRELYWNKQKAVIGLKNIDS